MRQVEVKFQKNFESVYDESTDGQQLRLKLLLNHEECLLVVHLLVSENAEKRINQADLGEVVLGAWEKANPVSLMEMFSVMLILVISILVTWVQWILVTRKTRVIFLPSLVEARKGVVWRWV